MCIDNTFRQHIQTTHNILYVFYLAWAQLKFPEGCRHFWCLSFVKFNYRCKIYLTSVTPSAIGNVHCYSQASTDPVFYTWIISEFSHLKFIQTQVVAVHPTPIHIHCYSHITYFCQIIWRKDWYFLFFFPFSFFVVSIQFFLFFRLHFVSLFDKVVFSFILYCCCRKWFYCPFAWIPVLRIRFTLSNLLKYFKLKRRQNTKSKWGQTKRFIKYVKYAVHCSFIRSFIHCIESWNSILSFIGTLVISMVFPSRMLQCWNCCLLQRK